MCKYAILHFDNEAFFGAKLDIWDGILQKHAFENVNNLALIF